MTNAIRRSVTLGVLSAAALALPTVTAQSASAPSSGVRVGDVALHRCDLGTTRQGWCGHIRVPFDYYDARAGTITVGFGWLPSNGTPRGTIVAEEGGPGYPATGTAPDYEAMFGHVLRHRNMLVVDARGTGRSTPIDCEPLQSLPSPSKRFAAAVRACGRQLDHTWKRRGGGWVHAADLFTTANTARDMARVIHALGLRKVTLYGDSYGTYVAQSFLARYPRLVRAGVLDSAYEARDLDPWYRTTVITARRAFDTVCRRSLRCPTESAWRRIGRLAGELRRNPITGRAVGTDDHRHRATVGVTALVNIVNDAGYDYDPYRQLDAAVRAYLRHRDRQPLLRLYLQDIGWDYSDYSAPATYYSDGLYMAVACTDYPQLFDMHSTPSARRRQLGAAIRKLPRKTFAPFTTREWLRVLPYTETYTGCLNWPRPVHRTDRPVPRGVSMDRTHVPVLILNGEIDSLTPAAGGAHIARQIGSAAHAYVAANTVHLVALDNPHPCGAHVVREFVGAPQQRLDASCLPHIPAIRAVPQFPRTLGETVPARGHAPRRIRRLAAVAVLESGDVVHRWYYVDGRRDRGMYGGTIRYGRGGRTATLQSVRFTRDTATTGRLHRTADGEAGTLTVNGVRFHVRWDSGERATITAARRRLSFPAP